jgi:hypothetical protein
MRTCSRCRELKPLDQFARDKTKTDGRRYICRPCAAQDQAARRAADPEKWRAYHRARYRANPEPVRAASRARYDYKRKREYNLRRAYGLSIDTVAEMIEAQQGRCALCRGEAVLVVDHDHASGRVRGMLCHRCNLLLGQIEKVGIEPVRAYLE